MEGTKEYILVLESRYADSRNGEKREVLRVVQGGTPERQGTWMDEKLALKFAAWDFKHTNAFSRGIICPLFCTSVGGMISLYC